MTRILVTNDDGVDAPALPLLARALEALGQVVVVAPDRERSWVGKAITRFEPVTVREVRRGGVDMVAVSGYPADAVQIGVHALGGPPPDLIVSGINLGYNHGAGFLMSSGTIGAAVEGWISGIDAIALSTGTMGDWHLWRSRAEQPEAVGDWERLAELSVELISLVGDSGLHALSDVVSINLPYESNGSTPRRVTTIARAGYDQLFAHRGEGIYEHSYGGRITRFEETDDTDIDAAHQGAISITPIRLPAAAAVPSEVRSRIERG